jgi:hypothetical protein
MSTPGRNEPCPCGSGRKYKNCCGAAAAEVAPPKDVIPNVVQFATSSAWNDAYERAVEIYMELLAELEPDEVEELMRQHPALPGLLNIHLHEWLLCDYVDEVTQTNVTDEYLHRRGWRESPRGREWLRALREQPLSLYEVQAIRPGAGLTLRDVLRDMPPVEVDERTGSRGLRQWDYLVTRVVPFQGRNFLSGAGLHYTREMGDDVRRVLMEDFRADGVEPTLADWNALLRDSGPYFWDRYVEPFIDPPPPPELVNAEGERWLISRQRFVFDPAVRGELRQRLAACAEFEPQGDDGYTWMQPLPDGENGVRPAGFVRLEKNGGQFEAFTRQKFEQGQQLLRDLWGDAVTFLPATFEDPWQAARHAPPAGKPENAPGPSSEEMRTLLHQAMDNVYRDWADTPVPMLHGKTPRQAVADPEGRQRVIDLLKLYENNEARNPPEQRYDFTWMWRELGLTRPGGEESGADDVLFAADASDDDVDEEAELLDQDLDRTAQLFEDIIREQMRTDDPPETRQTHDRLRSAGYSEEDTRWMISAAVAVGVMETLEQNLPFDRAAYVRRLLMLPMMPWAE